MVGYFVYILFVKSLFLVVEDFYFALGWEGDVAAPRALFAVDEFRFEVFFFDFAYLFHVVQAQPVLVGAHVLSQAALDFVKAHRCVVLEQGDALAHAFHAVFLQFFFARGDG